MLIKFGIIVVLISFISTIAYCESIKKVYSFSEVAVDDVNIKLEGTLDTAIAGKPILPFKQARILLPYNASVNKVEIIKNQIEEITPPREIEISSGFIANVRKTFAPTKELDLGFTYLKDDVVYSVQQYRGANILLVNLYPIFISNKSFYFSKDIIVKIHFNQNLKSTRQKVDQYTFEEISNLVDNHEIDLLKSYSFEDEKIEKDSYDYLIVTTNTFENSPSLKSFTDFLSQERKLKTKIINLNKTLNGFSGVDNAQKLRNLIIREYQQFSPRYLLLVGDSDSAGPQIPLRRLFASVRGYISGNWQVYNEQIPSDFYYGCLDGDFNYDNDDRWGEPKDGTGGGDVDFLCELTVGRIPVDSEVQLATVLEKTKQAYQLNGRDKNVLMLGELLFKEMDLWGADYMNQLIGDVNDHGFLSRGYDSSWNIFKLYEKEGAWSGRDAIALIEQHNPLMVNHLGHSNESMNMKLSTFSYRGMNNKEPYFYYSQGCLAANFTKNDSIIEKMIYLKGGPFAAVGNAPYGLGPEDPEFGNVKYPGTSQILHRYFMNRVLNDQYFSFGKAHQGSKEDILRYIAFQEARWVIYGANYLGDPAIAP